MKKYISFAKHQLSGTWTFEVHVLKESPAQGWDRFGFMNGTFYSKEEAEMAGNEFVSDLMIMGSKNPDLLKAERQLVKQGF